MGRRLALVGILCATLAWTTALIAAPVLAAEGGRAGPTVSALVYAAGSLVCHQRPDRSFHHGAAQLPVCARCLGLYAGACLGALAWAAASGAGGRPLPRIRGWRGSVRVGLAAAAAPTVVSVATAWLGWWDPGNATRAALALPLGAATAALVSAVVAGDLG